MPMVCCPQWTYLLGPSKTICHLKPDPFVPMQLGQVTLQLETLIELSKLI